MPQGGAPGACSAERPPHRRSVAQFREMLPVFGIELPEAKALKYFALCDVDGSGAISFDEFQVALYACDPSGNAQGFRPSQLLHPRDAFEVRAHPLQTTRAARPTPRARVHALIRAAAADVRH